MQHPRDCLGHRVVAVCMLRGLGVCVGSWVVTVDYNVFTVSAQDWTRHPNTTHASCNIMRRASPLAASCLTNVDGMWRMGGGAVMAIQGGAVMAVMTQQRLKPASAICASGVGRKGVVRGAGTQAAWHVHGASGV